MTVAASKSAPALSSMTPLAASHETRRARASVMCIPHSASAHIPAGADVTVEIEYNEEEDAITPQRLAMARKTYRFRDRNATMLSKAERTSLFQGQKMIQDALGIGDAARKTVKGNNFLSGLMEEEDEGEDEDEGEENGGEVAKPGRGPFEPPEELGEPAPPQDQSEDTAKTRVSVKTIKAQFMTAKLRSRLNKDNDGVMGIQSGNSRFNSIIGDKFGMYQVGQSIRSKGLVPEDHEDGEEEEKIMDVEDISYVRKPNLARIIEQYEAMAHHPKYHLKDVVLSRRFHLYAHRFANAQFQRTLTYPTLPQPKEMNPWLMNPMICGECKCEDPISEKRRSRKKGHRFIIAADSQFGILMDGFAMENPNWSQEIEISRKCVAQINAMHGEQRPLFVCVCGDLVDTESSFSGAIASWKKVMTGWERNLVFEQQVNDFKRVWAGLDPDIALVCLCGNHDVGNRPTKGSIKHWTDSFGDDYLSFWVNGTFNICLNNCLFSNPTGAQDLYEEQLQWMEAQMKYGRENDATHIFMYGHFPWFLKHEEEADDFLTSYSAAPPGWGPPGSSFADSYFTIPLEYRKGAMELCRKYDVTACFSGHFHQNVVAQTSWGMPMIVTGPLSMNLSSEIGAELSNGEKNGIGMRIVDVGERGQFTHKWILLDGEEEIYKNAMKRISRMSKKGISLKNMLEEEEEEEELDIDDIEALLQMSVSGLKVSGSQAVLAACDFDFED